MPHDFIPRRDGDFLLWVRNFVTQLQNDPDGYQVQPAVVGQLATMTEAFATVYAATKTSWRCPSYTQQKNERRRALEAFVRQVAKHIRSRWDMTDQRKQIAGLSLRMPGGFRPRQKRPEATPRVVVRRVQGPVATIWLIDGEGHRRRKPQRGMWAGVYATAAEHLTGQEQWQFVGACSWEMDVDLSKLNLAPGTRVWLKACWANSYGKGPMSTPVPVRVADGMVMPRVAA